MRLYCFKKCALFVVLLVIPILFGGCGFIADAFTNTPEPSLSPPETLIEATPVPTPTAAPTPAPTPVPILGVVTLKNDDSNLRVRSGPGEDYPIIGALGNKVVIGILNEGDDWHKISFANFPEAFTSASYVTVNNDAIPVINENYYVLPPSSTGTEIRPLPEDSLYELGDRVDIDADGDKDGTIVDTDEDDKGDAIEVDVLDHLVDIRQYIPSIIINQIFATEDNFTGKKLYSAEAPLVQYDMIQGLKMAQQRFELDGYCIKIYDAYRPHSVQQTLYDAISNPLYVADPAKASNHNRGAAIDMTLVDEDGNELEMPSAMYTYDETSHRDSDTMSDSARANMEYMTRIMSECGFTYYKYEWWHFNYKDAKDYMITDYKLSNLILIRNE